ncbi:helix-turn-helix domain-containing protein [Mycobacterium avium subsp. avium]|uniref:helix-turn-helix domain-containing protein n=1 Tax=Mycobacterium avium TaxID=1764 RepID=UPI001D157DB2|nr:helix-turn-helix domain-containing protein [Mycobacterium avium]UEA35276.1 helix-turn-helix domain-containing protein [Mycobacterium avium subsp. avium]UGU19326.1 helix-turn-helix domain-containing protein [Mycobacterium avium subsp. avium]
MLTIGEVARRSGVAATTLRYYEQIGLLPAPIRLGGQRRYDEAVLPRLEVIALCKTAGFALDEIQRLFADDAPGRPASRALARAKLAQIDAQLESLGRARAVIEWGMRCTCPSIDACTCGIHPTRPAPVGPDVRSARRF